VLASVGTALLDVVVTGAAVDPDPDPDELHALTRSAVASTHHRPILCAGGTSTAVTLRRRAEAALKRRRSTPTGRPR
jgi:hypothetical protein